VSTQPQSPPRDRLRRAGQKAAERLRRVRGPHRPQAERKPPPETKPARRKPVTVASAVALTLAVLVALFVILWDWNYLRGPIERIASARTGREVQIAGDLNVKLFSRNPSATVDGISIGNPAWAGKGNTASAERLAVQIRLLPLLRGQVVLQRLELLRPRADLRRDMQGRATWDFSKPGQPRGEPFKMPPVRRFVIDDGRLAFNDAKRKLTFEGTLNATEHANARNRGFEMVGRGRLNQQPFTMEVFGGPLLNIDPNKTYPFDADIRAGATHITAKGGVPEPFDLGDLFVDLTAQGPDLADLYGLTGLAFPNTPPYRLKGHLVRDEQVYTLAKLNGRVGDSDLSGRLKVDAGRERPLLTANLSSRRLDFDDLAAIFGGSPSTAAGETVSAEQKAVAGALRAQQRIFPDSTLDVTRIRVMDADVTYKAETINAPRLPLRAASVHVKLDNGLLTADPLTFTLPQGSIAGRVQLNARRDTPVTDLDLRLSNARIEQLITKQIAGGPPLRGALVGRVKLRGAGDSVHKAFANADGEVLVVVPGGQIRQAFAELLGINVTKALGLLLAKDQSQTEVRCAMAHFQANDGVLRANRIIFDTGPVLGTGSGTVNLGTERMAFRIEGHPKEMRLVRLMAPITVGGPIVAPKIGIEPGKAIVQGGIAAALGTLVTPLAAILPFIDPGLADDANCGALLASAKNQGVPVKTAVR
jgi:AsmA family protein